MDPGWENLQLNSMGCVHLIFDRNVEKSTANLFTPPCGGDTKVGSAFCNRCFPDLCFFNCDIFSPPWARWRTETRNAKSGVVFNSRILSAENYSQATYQRLLVTSIRNRRMRQRTPRFRTT